MDRSLLYHPRQRLNAARSGSRDGGSVARTLAAIDVNGLAGHEARRFQIENRSHDVRDLAHPAKRVQLGELRMCFDGMHRRLDDAGRNRIHSDAELCILDRQRFGRGTQAFVSEASTDGTCEFACSIRLVVICTTWPLCRFSISAMASCVMWKKPVRLTPST